MIIILAWNNVYELFTFYPTSQPNVCYRNVDIELYYFDCTINVPTVVVLAMCFLIKIFEDSIFHHCQVMLETDCLLDTLPDIGLAILPWKLFKKSSHINPETRHSLNLDLADFNIKRYLQILKNLLIIS